VLKGKFQVSSFKSVIYARDFLGLPKYDIIGVTGTTFTEHG